MVPAHSLSELKLREPEYRAGKLMVVCRVERDTGRTFRVKEDRIGRKSYLHRWSPYHLRLRINQRLVVEQMPNSMASGSAAYILPCFCFDTLVLWQQTGALFQQP